MTILSGEGYARKQPVFGPTCGPEDWLETSFLINMSCLWRPKNDLIPYNPSGPIKEANPIE